jgi:hypothetical protein
MGQGVAQLDDGTLLHQGLHVLSLIELEIQTYLLPNPSTLVAKIQDDLSGHTLPLASYISWKSLKNGLFFRASPTSVFGPCPG